MLYPESAAPQPSITLHSLFGKRARSFGVGGFSDIRNLVRRLFAVGLVGALALGCARAPSPLAPHFQGSIGMPHRGVLTTGAELPRHGDGYRWLRDDDRHHAVPRLVGAIETAARTVARDRPGASLVVGDLSGPRGGRLSGHASHRSGRDVDLLLYLTTLEGVPVDSPGFAVRVGLDGLAFDEKGERFFRFDVEREWLLVKSLVEDDAARIQFIFVSRPVKALLVEWARARSEPPDTIVRAMDVMVQPGPPAEAHDDHVHVRTACTPEEIGEGCEPTGPERAWLAAHDARAKAAADALPTKDLLGEILRPFGAFASHGRASQ
jgi:penicillin-insensitive murein endopeptidase